MKIPANNQNHTKISHPDKLGKEVVISRLRDASGCHACRRGWGLQSVAGSGLLGCSDDDLGEQEATP